MNARLACILSTYITLSTSAWALGTRYPLQITTGSESTKAEVLSADWDEVKASVTVKVTGVDKTINTLPVGSTLQKISLWIAPDDAQTLVPLENVTTIEINRERGYLIAKGEIAIAKLDSVRIKGDPSCWNGSYRYWEVPNGVKLNLDEWCKENKERGSKKTSSLLWAPCSAEDATVRNSSQLVGPTSFEIPISPSVPFQFQIWIIEAQVTFKEPNGVFHTYTAKSKPFMFTYGVALGFVAGLSIGYHFAGREFRQPPPGDSSPARMVENQTSVRGPPQSEATPQAGVSKSCRAAPSNLFQWAGGAQTTLAVAFTDVMKSTEMNQKLGDERMRRIIEPHFAKGKALIEHHSGWLIKTIGDSLLSVFRNVPDALDFALAIHSGPGHDVLGIRAGIHVGPVEVSMNDINGSTAKFAKRVTDKVESTGIWMSDDAKSHLDQIRPARHDDLHWRREVRPLKGFPAESYVLWALENPDALLHHSRDSTHPI